MSNIKCPKCKSTKLTANKKGYSAGNALVGVALTGGIGLLGGFVGSKKVKITCLNCGKQFQPGEGLKDRSVEQSKSKQNNLKKYLLYVENHIRIIEEIEDPILKAFISSEVLDESKILLNEAFEILENIDEKRVAQDLLNKVSYLTKLKENDEYRNSLFNIYELEMLKYLKSEKSIKQRCRAGRKVEKKYPGESVFYFCLSIVIFSIIFAISGWTKSGITIGIIFGIGLIMNIDGWVKHNEKYEEYLYRLKVKEEATKELQQLKSSHRVFSVESQIKERYQNLENIRSKFQN